MITIKLTAKRRRCCMILASFDDSYIIGFCQVKSSYIYEVDYILGSRRFYDFMLQLEIQVS